MIRSTRLPAAVWAIAAVTLALHVAASGDWTGWDVFRDELYFLACGHRLAAGYVDQPPVVALLARASEWLAGGPGGPLWRLRLLPFLLHCASVLIAARLALSLGARGPGAVVAAAATAWGGTLLVTGHLLTMNVVEPLLWTLLAAQILRALDGDDRGLVWAGVLVGLGALTKLSIAYWAVALFGGLLLTPARRVLWTRSALLGALAALLVAAPTIAWQALHGWPQLELLRNGQATKNAVTTAGGFLRGLPMTLGPPAVLLALVGLVALLVGSRTRALGLAAALCTALLALTGGKPYYLAPAAPLLFAASGAALERFGPRARALTTAASVLLLGAGAALVALVALPLLPVAKTAAVITRLGFEEQRLERHRYNVLPQHLADSQGWKNLAHEVQRVYEALPDRATAAIYAQNYGEAGALEWYAPALPRPLSGHNQYWLWSKARVDGGLRPTTMLIVGGDRPDDVFARCDVAATARSAWAMPYEAELPIWRCSEPRLPLTQVWPRVRHYE